MTSFSRLPILVFLATALVHATTAGLPAQDGQSEAVPRCPSGFFRSSELVFTPGAQETSRAAVFLQPGAPPGSARSSRAWARLTLPKGVQNLHLQAKPADGASQLSFELEDSAGKDIGGLEPGNSNVSWQGVSFASSLGSESSAKLQTTGLLPEALSLLVLRGSGSAHEPASGLFADLLYGYSGFTSADSQEVADGCSEYDGKVTRNLVFNWSAWVSSQHDLPANAWQSCCASFYGGKGVPFSAWRGVWSKWAEAPTQPPWQAAFKFIDNLQVEDGLLNEFEYSVAFNLAATELAMAPFCVYLHETYWNFTSAWGIAIGSSASSEMSWKRWSQLWSAYTPPFNFTKPSAAGSFTYADADSSGMVSRNEFSTIWDLCHDVPTLTPSPQTMSTSAMATSTSAMVGSMRDEATDVTTSEAAANKAGSCCTEVTAACLSCLAGLNVGLFCAQKSMSSTPGCPGVPLPQSSSVLTSATAPITPREIGGSAAGESGSQCPYLGVAYSPLLHGQKVSTELSPAKCQARCGSVPGCAHFTFWQSSSRCELHSPAAHSFQASDATAGPATCIADIHLRISGVDFGKLLAFQLTTLRASLAEVVAKFAGVPPQSVQDLEGQGGGMSLSSGSLIADGHVMLPIGAELADLASRASLQPSFADLQSNVSKAMAESNVQQSGQLFETSGSNFPLEVSVKAATGCWMTGTQYQTSVQETKTAVSVSKCQTLCATSADCAFFSFWLAGHRCQLLGEDAEPMRNSSAISGPAVCPPSPAADQMSRGFSLPGTSEIAADSKTAVGKLTALPWYWIALLLCVLIISMVLLCLFMCPGRGKRRASQGKSGGGEVLYLPISSKDEDEAAPAQAREVRSRDAPGSGGTGGTTPACAIAFHGPEMLSWRQNGNEASALLANGRTY
eukprot:TRINITY_DN63893_c0_g1_i1.p1 TRINITY_DN63893_c0_g1~~TRINITY_DN63893_c0_g1_i1.p1  ORF type:complete len:903 (-),score=154.27 TRINITY_DN63893_c0_g1_i1:38-2746(-)